MAAPTVQAAAGGPALVVRVEPYAGMSAGDEVQLRWDTGVLRTSLIDCQVIGDAEVGEARLFTIERPVPCTARVSYLVGRDHADWRASPRLTVTIQA
ncbi:hypothetical protein ACIBKX_15750 [Streptomyces sp. NPDC050658]|uniref:hypothetical protein n=1 Tax=unclassified Streptomyces TaxID=2593676 RepID=UPI003436BA57